MDERTCLDISEFIGVLANPHRVRILCFLAEGERAVGRRAMSRWKSWVEEEGGRTVDAGTSPYELSRRVYRQLWPGTSGAPG